MAVGDVTVFNEAKGYLLDGGFEAADTIKIALCDNTTAPTASTTTPTLADFTQVGTSGSYVSGGTSLGTLGDAVTVTGGTAKFDSSTNPSWAQHASNDTDCSWGIIYNDTDGTDRAIAFVELGTADMQAGTLTITWNASGIFTYT